MSLTPREKLRLEYYTNRVGLLSKDDIRTLFSDNARALCEVDMTPPQREYVVRQQARLLNYLELLLKEDDDSILFPRFTVDYTYSLKNSSDAGQSTALCFVDVYGRKPDDEVILSQVRKHHLGLHPNIKSSDLEIVLL